MSESQTAGSEQLQFDRVVVADAAGAQPHTGITCSVCHLAIPTEYYTVNGHVVCAHCRENIEDAVETPRGAGTLLVAALFGLGAGLAGAFIYFAVIYFANLEIGIVAILIGYMVGYAVRKGARGRGGLRFQILAIALTYGSIAMAYAPLVVIAAVKDSHEAQGPGAAARQNTQSVRPAPRAESRERPPAAIVLAEMLAFIAVLPVLVIWNTLPSGLITVVIIFIGMRQAWRMTGAPPITVFGPYQVGGASVPESA
jgi:hypothetical protein